MQTRGEAVTLGQLLALNLLPEAELIGDTQARQRVVRMVIPGTTARDVAELPGGALVVFGRSQLAVESVSLDVAIRLGLAANIAGIVVERSTERDIPLAGRRLAQKLGVALVVLPHVEPAGLVARLDPYAREPAVAGAELLRTVVERLTTSPLQTKELVRRTGAVLGCPVALVDGSGHVVEGAVDALDDAACGAFVELTRRGDPAARVIGNESGAIHVIHPAAIASNAPANLWFVARLPADSSFALDAARTGLAIAAVAYAAQLSTSALYAERQTHQRALLLTDILEHSDVPRRHALEQATALGWRLSGWHTAVHLVVRALPPAMKVSEVTGAVDELLRPLGVQVGLIERLSGWACWLTTDLEQTPDELTVFVRAVRRAVLLVERDNAGLSLCGGIGGSYESTAGLRRSLQEAHEACLLARTEDVAGSVQHVDPMNVRRLLIGWYASGPLRDVASALIKPLIEAEPGGELVRTLRVYLDQESNATDTSHVLGVHRNTVLNRLERIRGLLAIDLRRPADRLAVHLAVHVAALDDHRQIDAADPDATHRHADLL
jgi:PucR family transcriptional regulator, purine catabolism regulatory protein